MAKIGGSKQKSFGKKNRVVDLNKVERQRKKAISSGNSKKSDKLFSKAVSDIKKLSGSKLESTKRLASVDFKTKNKRVAIKNKTKTYSFNERLDYHEGKRTDYSDGFVHGAIAGKPLDLETNNSYTPAFKKGIENSLSAKRKALNTKFK